MSPASGDDISFSEWCQGLEVSIQLMSPASGDGTFDLVITNENKGFHSINVPSEWGR